MKEFIKKMDYLVIGETGFAYRIASSVLDSYVVPQKSRKIIGVDGFKTFVILHEAPSIGNLGSEIFIKTTEGGNVVVTLNSVPYMGVNSKGVRLIKKGYFIKSVKVK